MGLTQPANTVNSQGTLQSNVVGKNKNFLECTSSLIIIYSKNNIFGVFIVN
jgi:hypothetical protein